MAKYSGFLAQMAREIDRHADVDWKPRSKRRKY